MLIYRQQTNTHKQKENKMTNANTTTANTTTATRGRPSTVATSKQRAAHLQSIVEGNAPSRFIVMQLADAGLVQFEPVQTGTRGRPKHTTVLTGKARSLLALAKRWK